jgi:hypothetical protein
VVMGEMATIRKNVISTYLFNNVIFPLYTGHGGQRKKSPRSFTRSKPR